MPPMLITTDAFYNADTPDGSEVVTLNLPTFPPAMTAMFTVLPLRVPSTFSWEWSG
ncbi:putative carbohydrate esterase family 15 protein [Neurospora intermedia]|uniref:Carbohydrate esterase family 15 protein n=1 Tax=Neurospora intermedia TaxID=5142 RepID=A0ABR3DQW2_NEUIN